MKDWEKIIRSYFSFSSKEKRGMLVLTSILFLLLCVRVYQRLLPRQYSEIEIIALEKEEKAYESSKMVQQSKTKKVEKKAYAEFDPNTATFDELLGAGLSSKQSTAFINYRNAGVVFKSKEDLKRLFWMTERLYHNLNVSIQEKPISKESKETKTKKAEKPLFELNSIDSSDFISIKGIGTYTANHVLKYREWLGGFYDTFQLREIRGLREAQIQTIKENLKLNPLLITKISINHASEVDLQKHPYIRYKAKVIIRYREEHGPYKSKEDFLKTGVFTDEMINKLLPYLDFRA